MINFPKTIRLTLISIFIPALFLFAGDAGENGFAFLKVDVDGRAAGMAGAYTAISSDAGASFWNPAGLAAAQGKTFIIMHNVWLADISQEFAAVHFIKGKHNFAASVNLMTIPDIEIRGEKPSDQPDGKVDAINFSGALSYARTIANTWQVGLSVKYLFEKYYTSSAPGWAVDFGLQKRQIIKDLDWGLTVQNLGKMSKLSQIETPLPLMIRSGLGYRLPYILFDKKPLVAAELQYIKDENIYFRFGAQVDVREYLSLRSGVILGGEDNHFTTGLSLKYAAYHLDYAFVPFQYDLGNSHRFSFGMDF